jgi:hypothetical protein
MDNIWKDVAQSLQHAQQAQSKAANKYRKDIDHAVGDMVYVSTKNMKTERPARKLEQKWIGPFPVAQKIGHSYRLTLPSSMKIMPDFHASLLRKDPADPLPGQHAEPQPPVFVDSGGDKQWEVERIVASRWKKQGRGKTLEYRAKWVGYDDDPQWYPARNFEDAPNLMKDYHDARPEDPGPHPDLPKWLKVREEEDERKLDAQNRQDAIRIRDEEES